MRTDRLKACIPVLVLLAALIVPMVSAQNMSVSDLGLSGDQTIQVFAWNETAQKSTLYGSYNTSADAIPLPEGDFNIVIKPTVKRQYIDGGQFLDSFLNYLQSHLIELFLLLAVAGLFLKRK